MRGSSPLARGLRNTRPGKRKRGGIIPARAGFTAVFIVVFPSVGDHPRSRGVYNLWGPDKPAILGSSPLARGLPPKRTIDRLTWRIIPARAGFTPFARVRPRGRPDHPRSRGVYSRMGPPTSAASGSSPLARGLPHRRRAAHLGRRIIPARAGFTGCATTCARRRRDHPRSRGVYLHAALDTTAQTGSSPLARGLLSGVHRSTLAAGIIPARAGFTGVCRVQRHLPPDHPRSRGVYWRAGVGSPPGLGSSPLARGLLHRSREGDGALRIIPARAGFTRT